jgi:hypothetical protein
MRGILKFPKLFFLERVEMNGIAWMEKRYYNDVVLSMSEFTRGTTQKTTYMREVFDADI